MKIKYEFADGDVEVDVPNEWASILVELDRLERNNDKKERRRHYSLDSCVYEGIVYASEDKNLTAIFETDSKFGRLTEAIKYLSDKQKSLIKAVYFDGMSVSDYAKHMGISQSAVSQQLKTIYKKPYISVFLCPYSEGYKKISLSERTFNYETYINNQCFKETESGQYCEFPQYINKGEISPSFVWHTV